MSAPDPKPALSKTYIHEIYTKSPRHAWVKNRHLNPDYVPEDPAKYDVGTVAHQMLLENDDSAVFLIEGFSDYRKKEAQEARDYARSLGQIPMLQKQLDEVLLLVERWREGISRLDVEPHPFTDGKHEQWLECEEDGVLLRGRADWVRDDLSVIEDLKTTASVAPRDVARQIFKLGHDIQATLYPRILHAMTGKRAQFRFVFCETEPPYAVACYELSPAALALADEKIAFAMRVWKDCLARDEWPAYPTGLMTVEPDGYEETRLYERLDREGMAA